PPKLHRINSSVATPTTDLPLSRTSIMANPSRKPLDQHAQQLLFDAGQVGNQSTERYYDWVKQMLSLSFAALTALVALQNNYIPGSDLARYLLWGTFLSLTASVVCAAIDIRGAAQGLRSQFHQMV